MSRLYEARRDLALSLKDTKSVVGSLEMVIGLAVHVVFVFFYLWVFNVSSQRARSASCPRALRSASSCLPVCRRARSVARPNDISSCCSCVRVHVQPQF